MSIKRTCLMELRKAKRLTALAVAEQAGLSENQVFAVERGRSKISIDNARRWADVLGVPLEKAFSEGGLK